MVKHFADHGLQIPDRLWRERKGEVVWRRLRHARVLSILHNPFYAGAYVYGRTTDPAATSARRSASRQGLHAPGQARRLADDLERSSPRLYQLGQFRRNQEQLDDNRTFDPDHGRGAVREGSLLQGIVGLWGLRSSHDGALHARWIRPIYVCARLHTDFAGKTCQFMRGDGIDAAVAQLLLAAIEPAQLTIALEAVEHLEAQAQAIERQWHLRLERPLRGRSGQAPLSGSGTRAPLVARSLERDWNEKLTRWISSSGTT